MDPSKLRILIIDDEPLAREKLRSFLQREPDVEILGEAGDGTAAVNAIRQNQPNLVFLDVQMPEFDGFEVLGALAPEELPVVVFVTAHDDFALRAFEVHAVDYLLKPFDRGRFQKALEHARLVVRGRSAGTPDAHLAGLLKEFSRHPSHPDRIAVKSGGRIILVKTEDIDWIEAADNYAALHVGKESHLLRETMSAMEKRLDPGRFLRISRSVIVNVDRVKELHPLFHGEYAIQLHDGTKLNSSRGYRKTIQRLLQ